MSVPGAYAFTAESHQFAAAATPGQELNANPEVNGIICQLPVPDHLDGVELTGLNCPVGLAFDKSGNLWVAFMGEDRVARYNASRLTASSTAALSAASFA